MSAQGLQQGDSLSALLFSLPIKQLLNELSATIRVGYLDYVTLGGAAHISASDVEHIKASAEQYGLILNISNSELIAQDPNKVSGFAAFKDFRLIKLEDMSLLGAPIVDNRAMEATLKEKTHLLEKAISTLKELNTHDGLTTLKSSLEISKIM